LFYPFLSPDLLVLISQQENKHRELKRDSIIRARESPRKRELLETPYHSLNLSTPFFEPVLTQYLIRQG